MNVKVNVSVFPDLAVSQRGDIANLCPNVRSSLGLLIPEGFTLKGGERKFVVMVCEHEVLLAIGPTITAINSDYSHSELRAVATGWCCKEREIRATGVVSFEFDRSGWRAHFSGLSCEVSKFPDPFVKSSYFWDTVSAAMKMRVSFDHSLAK